MFVANITGFFFNLQNLLIVVGLVQLEDWVVHDSLSRYIYTDSGDFADCVIACHHNHKLSYHNPNIMTQFGQRCKKINLGTIPNLLTTWGCVM